MKLSVYIITFNEEARLAKTLQAAKRVADEIIVVDSGSTDKTKQIAESFGCNFIYHAWENYAPQKHFAQESCSNDYVLLLDADEILSERLIDSINKEKTNFRYGAYKIKRMEMNPTDTKRCFGKTQTLVRLYNKRCADMPQDAKNRDTVKVHDGTKTVTLNGLLYHYSIASIGQAVEKYNTHSTLLAKTAVSEGKHYSKFRLFIEFPRQFLKYYFIHKYFAYGTYGFIQAMILAYFRFLKVAKAISYWNKYE